MNYLNTIVCTFSIEEQLRFISFLEKKNKRNDTKNIQLFKYLLKDNLTSKDICFKLYTSHKNEAYHALRKRLYQSIIEFSANASLLEENSVDMQIIKFILASRKFLHKKQYKLAYNLLDKAETLAKEHYLFTLLNEIYHTKIQYAHATPSVSIDKLIVRFKENQKNHFLEDQLNIVYTKIRQTINEINYKRNIVDFETILNNTLEEHNISFNESMSFKSLYQLMTIMSLSAFATNDYLKTEPFLIHTYNSILSRKTQEKQLYYHIQITHIIANTLFRNKKFIDSLHYLDIMHQHMLLHQKKHYNTFKLKHQLLLALNLNYLNKQDDAINILKPLTTIKHIDLETQLKICLSLIMCYFQKNEFRKAHSVLSKFYHTDLWYTEKAGIEWVLKKNLIEILLHIELENIDLFESKLLSFKRSHFSYLKKINQHRVITYLGFVEAYYKSPESVRSIEFKNKVEASFTWIGKEREDIFVMSFYAWLKSKMDKRGLYETTLHFVKETQEAIDFNS